MIFSFSRLLAHSSQTGISKLMPQQRFCAQTLTALPCPNQ